jgi:hypothetical protein
MSPDADHETWVSAGKAEKGGGAGFTQYFARLSGRDLARAKTSRLAAFPALFIASSLQPSYLKVSGHSQAPS